MYVAKTTRHATYNLNYHLIWLPKYRHPVLADKVKERVASILGEIAEDKGLEVLDLTIQPDHIHLFVSSPPKHAPALLVNWFKGISSRKYNYRHVDSDDEKLRRARGYYAGSAGKVSSETVKQYIQRQEGPK